MPYIVTTAGFDSRGCPLPSHPYQTFSTSNDAIAYASELLTKGEVYVAIQDGNGSLLWGDELRACCKGDKRLTHDLQIV